MGATRALCKAYNAQCGGDGEAQMIVAAEVTQQSNDKQQLVPMLLSGGGKHWGGCRRRRRRMRATLVKRQITDAKLQGIDLYVAPERLKHGEKIEDQAPSSAPPTLIEQMREKLKSAQGHAVYKMRKAIVEPCSARSRKPEDFADSPFAANRK